MSPVVGWQAAGVIRHQIDIQFVEVDRERARDVIGAHHLVQPYAGDSFLPSSQLSGTPMAIVIDGAEVGLVVVADGSPRVVHP